MSEWHAYVAGLFDGEGWVSIARVRANGMSDYHKMVVGISQRAKHREVLDRICEEFGGAVLLANQRTRVAERWAVQAKWQLQHKPSMQHFLETMQPYVWIKRQPVAVGLEFLGTFQVAANARDALGRIRGRMLTADEIERRERLRLAMRDANELGPPRAKPSILPPLDVQQRRAEELVPDFSTVERGTQRYNAHFTDEIVRAMRAEFAAGGVTKAELARRHGVTFMAIHKALTGKTWAHVT